VHVLRRLRRKHAPQCLSELRRRLQAAANSAGDGVAARRSLAKQPGSTQQVRPDWQRDEISEFVECVSHIDPLSRSSHLNERHIAAVLPALRAIGSFELF
jgi:hypothetical protein